MVTAPRTGAPGLTVLYDGACPLCRREIAHARRLAHRQGGAGIDFVDIAQVACPLPDAPATPTLLARFHVLPSRWPLAREIKSMIVETESRLKK